IKQSALRIQVSPEKLVSRNVTHYVTEVEMEAKRHFLVKLLNLNPEAKTVVFVRTKVRAERVVKHLAKNKIEALVIHGDMEQAAREKSLELFRELQHGILVATDVSARGIDISGINLVVNYDLPDDPENYVHRVGRTGRGFAKGEAVSLYAPEEKAKLQQIEELLQTKIAELKLGEESVKEIAENEIENMSIEDMLAAEEARFLR
ncbi:MAG: C-terminal helicase domain-containing protein, partial [Bdellovibrionia bacterium]